MRRWNKDLARRSISEMLVGRDDDEETSKNDEKEDSDGDDDKDDKEKEEKKDDDKPVRPIYISSDRGSTHLKYSSA